MPNPYDRRIEMLIAVHSQLQRHRRKIVWGVAMLIVVGAALLAKTALGNSHAHGDLAVGSDDVITICILGATCIAVVVVAAFSIPRLRRRRLWRLKPLPLPASAYIALHTGFLVRAGPSPLSLQVFRL